MISNQKFGSKLIIFDCDGVLIDSEIIAARVEARIANELGHNITINELITRFVGRPTRVVWETLLSEIGKPFTEEFFRYAYDEVHKAFDKELVAIEGAKEVLQSLSNEHGVKICVASTTRLDSLKRNLEFVALHDYFDGNIFSASQVKRPKPFPDVYLFAAQQMGFESKDCLVFEDSEPGTQAAIAAKMSVIGFCGASHILPGHDENLLRIGAKTTVKSFDEIIPTFEKWLEMS